MPLVGGQAVLEGVMMRNGTAYGLGAKLKSEIVGERRLWSSFLSERIRTTRFLRGFPVLVETLINGIKTELFYRDFDPLKVTEKDIIAARVLKYNALRFKMGAVPQNVYRMCDSLGMYVIAQIPINTSKSGLSRRIGGNPSNDPKWKAAYLDRAETAYRTTCGQASVIGYVMAEESSNGINLYETYLRLKALERKRPILYIEAAGEWNSD